MKPILAASAFAALATTASAGDTTYLSYGADVGTVQIFGTEISIGGAFVGGEYDTGTFLFTGEASLQYLDVPGGSGTLARVETLTGYRMEPNLMLLAGLNYNYSWTNSGSGDSLNYSLGFEHDRGRLVLGAYGEGGETASDKIVGYLGYQISEATEVAFEVEKEMTDDDPFYTLILAHERGPLEIMALWETDFDNEFISLGGSYDINDRFRGTARIGYLGDGLASYQVGAGYQVARNAWLEGSFTTIQNAGFKVEQFELNLTFETGSKHLTRSRIEDWKEESRPIFIF